MNGWYILQDKDKLPEETVLINAGFSLPDIICFHPP
jgi:hypothetical protein